MLPSLDLADVLLFATNSGDKYNAHLRQAFIDRFEWNTLDASGGAIVWVSLAGSAARAYIKQSGTDYRFTVADRLTLARDLAVYYEEHLSEFAVEDRIASAKRLGLPGLNVKV